MADVSDAMNAIKAGDVDQFRVMLETNPHLVSERDETGLSALMMAAYCRQPEIIELILASGVEPDMFEASAVGLVDRVATLLQSDATSAQSWAPDGFTPLHLACFFAHPSIVELLLSNNADANVVARQPSRLRPIHAAAAGRSTEIITMLLAAGADPNVTQQGGYTPLHAAVQQGDEAMARVLMEGGADINATDDEGRAPRELLPDDAPSSLREMLR